MVADALKVTGSRPSNVTHVAITDGVRALYMHNAKCRHSVTVVKLVPNKLMESGRRNGARAGIKEGARGAPQLLEMT